MNSTDFTVALVIGKNGKYIKLDINRHSQG